MIAMLVPVLAPVFAAAGIGFLWARSPHPFELAFVTRLITFVGAPCLVFSTLTRLEVPPETILRQAAAALVAVAAFGVLGGLVLRLAGSRVRPFLPTIMLPNTGNLGLPISYFAFGDEGLALGIAFAATITLCHFTIGVTLASGRAAWIELVRTPTLYAIAAALAFATSGLAPPAWIANATALLGGVTLPLMLIALGVSLASLRVHNLRQSLGLAVLRLGLGLAVGLALVRLAGIAPPAAGIIVLQCAMPPAVFNYLFAARYGGPAEEVAGAIVVATLISFATLPFLLAWLMVP